MKIVSGEHIWYLDMFGCVSFSVLVIRNKNLPRWVNVKFMFHSKAYKETKSMKDDETLVT